MTKTRMRTPLLTALLSAICTITHVIGGSLLVGVADSDRLPWARPMKSSFHLTQAFDLPSSPWGSGHRGIDIVAQTGTETYAPASATVKFVGRVVDRDVITLELHQDLLVSMEPVKSDLQVGDQVVRGQHIGEVASGGHCAMHCLHIGVRAFGEYVNPLQFYLTRPVLLPWE